MKFCPKCTGILIIFNDSIHIMIQHLISINMSSSINLSECIFDNKEWPKQSLLVPSSKAIFFTSTVTIVTVILLATHKYKYSNKISL